MKSFATKDALPLLDLAFEGPEPSNLENYLPPSQNENIFCTTQEREDYEEYAEVAFTEDVISDQADYDNFVRYLAEQCNLTEY